MGKVFETISTGMRAFIEAQHLFFVATAPLSPDGHVNLSPKGLNCLRILGENCVAYLDMTGSGNETSAHLAENGRITFMFCAFEGAANIVRLHGIGRTILPDMPEWDSLLTHFRPQLGMRQIIIAEIERISSSCGYAVPFMDFREERETLTKYWQVKGSDAVHEYWREKNARSIDGLPTPLSQSDL